MTSLYGALAVFSVVGFMAKQQNISIADVASKGPGLVFLTYPKGVTQMPVPPVWAALFFVMIFLIGIDSQFVGVEAFVTPIIDYFPKTLHRTRNRMIFTAGYCILAYLIGLTMVTEGGMYVMQLFDYYSASGLVILWVCFFESVVIGWVFGANRFYDVIELMIGKRINIFMKICCRYLTPLVTAFRPLTYNTTYIYPTWAQVVGVCLAVVSIISIPVTFIVNMIRTDQGQSYKKSRCRR